MRGRCLMRLRCVWRAMRLSSEDQYSGGADSSAEYGSEAERCDQRRGSRDEDDGDDLLGRAAVQSGAANGADGRGSAGAQGWAGKWLDQLAAEDAGRVDSGERFAIDAQGDLSGLVGEEERAWKLR